MALKRLLLDFIFLEKKLHAASAQTHNLTAPSFTAEFMIWYPISICFLLAEDFARNQGGIRENTQASNGLQNCGSCCMIAHILLNCFQIASFRSVILSNVALPGRASVALAVSQDGSAVVTIDDHGGVVVFRCADDVWQIKSVSFLRRIADKWSLVPEDHSAVDIWQGFEGSSVAFALSLDPTGKTLCCALCDMGDANVHVAILSRFPFSARRPHTDESFEQLGAGAFQRGFELECPAKNANDETTNS